MKRKILLATCFLIIASSALVSAQVSIETSVSRSRLAVGEELTLDIIISNAQGDISQPKISSIEGFSSYSQGRSQEISIINGRSSSRNIFTYVLIANSTGKKSIGPFEVNIGGRNYTIAAVEVDVVPDTGGMPGPSGGPSQGPVYSPPSRALPAGDISNEDIFVKAWLDKDEVFVNEPAVLTYTIYTRLSATYKGFDEEPVTTGFWVEEFPPEKSARKTEQFFNGRRYVVADVRKLALFPTQAGVFTIDTGALASTVELRQQDDFDSFFSYNVFGRRTPAFMTTQIFQKTLNPDKVTLTVNALPEAGKPESFSGAVGEYRIESSLDKKEVEEGNPATYRVRIMGRGNINTVQTPALPAMPDFKVYDSSSAVNISKDRLVVEGEKITETVLVPKKAGYYTIPALGFSYFDPKDKSYKELKTQAQPLVVKPGSYAPGESSQGLSLVRPVEKEEVALLGKDIRYIKTESKSYGFPLPPLRSFVAYWILNSILLAMTLVFMFLSASGENTPGSSRVSRLKRSHGEAKKRLKVAAGLLKQDKQDEFYAEIEKAITHYFATKLGLSLQSITSDSVREILAARDMGPEILDEIRRLFDELGHGRYSSIRKDREDMKALYNTADRLITKFEKVKDK